MSNNLDPRISHLPGPGARKEMRDTGNKIECLSLLPLLILLLQENFENFCLSDSKSVNFQNKKRVLMFRVFFELFRLLFRKLFAVP